MFFDGPSGAVTVTISAGNTGAKSIDCTGFTGTLAGSAALSVAGGFKLAAGMTRTYTGALTFTASGAITSAGLTWASALTFNGAGATFTINGDLLTSSSITLTAGTIDALSTPSNITSLTFSSSGAGVRALTMSPTKSYTISGTGVSTWNSSTNTNFTCTDVILKMSDVSNASKGATFGTATALGITFKVAALATNIIGSISGNLVFLNGGAEVTVSGTTIIGGIDTSALSPGNYAYLRTSARGTVRSLSLTTVSSAVNLVVEGINSVGAALTVTGGVNFYSNTGISFANTTPADLADAVWDEVVDGAFTARQLQRLMAAILLGKVSGAGTGTEVFRDLADTKDRVTATVDGNGNRTAITRDAA